ncbi:Hsp20/alpha crystallin family protein [Bacillus xiapuensis]|uniref:Hsp20/alpha crystallin family protein n=1 Tax=Bacillus xiapuensis TaxID=2014075 RepID=UPI000C25061D|nr:Hsp20/alpha crystallin family protein [Bacillus xiapuensis]
MALIPSDPFRHLANMRKELEGFFSEFPSNFGTESNMGGIRVDVYERDNEVVAACDLPGLESKDDIDIDIENNLLTISGSMNRSNEVNEENMYRKERYFGRFHRAVALPAPVSQEGVKASYKNGVLEVVMPKRKKDDKKRIEVDFS